MCMYSSFLFWHGKLFNLEYGWCENTWVIESISCWQHVYTYRNDMKMSHKIHIIFITHVKWGAKNLIRICYHIKWVSFILFQFDFRFYVIFHARFPLHGTLFLFTVCQSMHLDSNCCGYVVLGLCLRHCAQLLELLLPMPWIATVQPTQWN